MLDIDSSRSGPSKKRKDNDGRANVPNVLDNTKRSGVDGNDLSYFNKSSCNNDTSSQLDRMETIMMRMEQKLASMSSLESRCAELEAKCSSLENMLEASTKSVMEHIDDKFDSLNINLDKKCSSLEDKMEKLHKYNDMLVRNQSWEYSVETKSKEEWLKDGYDNDGAEYLAKASEELKNVTTKMRQGEFTDEKLRKIKLDCEPSTTDTDGDYSAELLPAWREFAAALEQFTPAIDLLPENCKSCFELDKVQLHGVASTLVKEALINKPFKSLFFVHSVLEGDEHNILGGLSVDAIMDIAESNKHLRALEISCNCINRDHIERLCSIVHNHPSLEELFVANCFHPIIGNADLGDSMLTSLLSRGELKLKKLNLRGSCITPAVGTMLAAFLESNPPLEYLNLRENQLNDDIVPPIADALRSNNTLRELLLGLSHSNSDGFGITFDGLETFESILFGERSLNAFADSNHTLESFDRVISMYNPTDESGKPIEVKLKRGAKIYFLLSERNRTLTNAEHFGDIDVKILPNMLQSVQRYAQSAKLRETYSNAPPIYEPVESLSIVYEVMRRWDKVFSLYE